MNPMHENGRTPTAEKADPMDPIGPHGADNPSDTGAVSGGGGEDKAPLNFDDEEIYSGRGKAARAGGTTHAQGGDSGSIGAPTEQLSDRNGPSDPPVR
jgi:hypothetical protein